MSEATIGVALISCDGTLSQLKTLLPQLSKFDQVVVGFNGQDPKIKNYLKNLSAKKGSPYEWFQFDWRPSAIKSWTDQEPENVKRYDINDWGFCYARNLTFNRLTTTHALWLDTDDLIGFIKDGKDHIVSPEQAYRAFHKIATDAPEDVDVWFFDYIYSRDSDNNPNVVNARERLVKNPKDWTWVYPIHEVLIPNHPPKHAVVSDVKIIHYPISKPEASRDRNIRMLLEWYDQLCSYGDDYDRDRGWCLRYIGESYWGMEDYQKAVRYLGQFIREYPKALDIEKWQAWCFIAKSQLELNNFEAARAAALAAIDIEPGLCDGYILLAQAKLVTEQDPQDILVLLDLAGHTEEPPPQVIKNPLDYSYTVYCIISKCKYLLGQYDAALEWAIKACAACPTDARAEQLRSDAAIKIRERDAVNAAKALYQIYFDYDENEKASKLYEVLPYPAQQHEDIIEAATLAHHRVRHLTDREAYVSLYTENSHWTPVPEEYIDSGSVPGEARSAYILERLKKALPNGGRILDVGCSDGFHSMMFAKNGFEVVGVDLDPRCVEVANERARKRGLPAIFIHGFFEEMNPDKMLDPFDVQEHALKDCSNGGPCSHINTWRNHFDAVVCAEVIEHVQNPQFLMGCLIDCAKDGAPVIITTPDEAFDKGDTPEGGGMYEAGKNLTGHVRIYTQELFEALMKSDPEVDVVESHFLPYNFAYRDRQGWQVGEIRRQPHKNGPVIRIYCGPNVSFSPDSLEDKTKAIAGSEVAVINMAREWAKLGCQVVVYSGVNGIYDGVFYRTADHYSPEHYSDIFISWRLPTVFEHVRPNAKHTVLWTHDLYYQITVPPHPKNHIPESWVDRIDTIVAVSNFHKDVLERMHPSLKGKIWASRNGIDASRYLDRDIEKVPHRYFYSSDWQRGIEQLVEVWPKIKEEIPDAELHVAYSYDLIQRLHKMTGDIEGQRRVERIYSQIKALDGVHFYDRLGQQELADLQLSCEAWLYPPDPNNPDGGFLETYCITAVEAQAARAYPVCRNNGALPEVLRDYIEWKDNWTVQNVLEALKTVNSGSLTAAMDRSQEWALSQTWESLAVEWIKQLALKQDEVTVS